MNDNHVTEVVIEPGQTSITLRRRFRAPRELVYACMTQPQHVCRWYGPRDGKMIECTIDLRVGGKYRYVIENARGVHAFSGEYRELVPGQRIVQTWCYEGYPSAVSIETATFAQEGEHTLVTLHAQHSSVANRDGHVNAGMKRGAVETMDRLDELLAEQAHGELLITRTFAAPRALVYEAWTRPEHLSRWWGPTQFDVPECRLNVRVGGEFHAVMRAPDGQRHGFSGKFMEVVPNERLVFVGTIEGSPERTITTDVTFADDDGATRIALRQTRPAVKEHAEGQRMGWTQSFEKLERVLAR